MVLRSAQDSDSGCTLVSESAEPFIRRRRDDSLTTYKRQMAGDLGKSDRLAMPARGIVGEEIRRMQVAKEGVCVARQRDDLRDGTVHLTDSRGSVIWTLTMSGSRHDHGVLFQRRILNFHKLLNVAAGIHFRDDRLVERMVSQHGS